MAVDSVITYPPTQQSLSGRACVPTRRPFDTDTDTDYDSDYDTVCPHTPKGERGCRFGYNMSPPHRKVSPGGRVSPHAALSIPIPIPIPITIAIAITIPCVHTRRKVSVAV